MRVTIHQIATSDTHTGATNALERIISTVASSLDLEEVLAAIVRLLSDAAAVHACFVYLLEDGAERLVLRAASGPYAHLVGQIELTRGESLAWWALERREPAAILEGALADPRNKYVPELEEERFQSLLSVPVLGRDGDPIGVISLHTEAPREFTPTEVDMLASTASLVAGAIENARLYEESRRRVGELEHLTALAEEIARAQSLEEILPAVTARARDLLRAETCSLYLLDAGAEELRLRASSPPGAAPRPSLRLAELGPELARSGRVPTTAVPLVANDELLGLLRAEGTDEVDLARAVANQAAVAIKKIELIEHLTERNLIKDFFEELASGRRPVDLEARTDRLGFDPRARYLVAVAGADETGFERVIASLAPGSLFDRRDDSLRALVKVPPSGEHALVEAIRSAQAAHAPDLAVGLSNGCGDLPSFAAGFEEARHALLGASVLRGRPGVVAYEELGPYKYLLRMSLDSSVRDAHREAVARLAAYDRQRSTSLLRTLEEFLRRHGNISATAEALYIHPNTLRQRLRRITELSGLDLRRDDWLMVEIAVKLVRLEEASGAAATHTPGRKPL